MDAQSHLVFIILCLLLLVDLLWDFTAILPYTLPSPENRAMRNEVFYSFIVFCYFRVVVALT